MNDELKTGFEKYPFPIAYRYNKVSEPTEDNYEKLKHILDTAETTIKFLALLTLAQMHRDLLNNEIPNKDRLKETIDLSRPPSFGTWYGLSREVMRAYRDIKVQLIVPELFNFWFRESSGKKLRVKPLHSESVEPLLRLRNIFSHKSPPKAMVKDDVTNGSEWLSKLLEEVHFLARYELFFTRDIKVVSDSDGKSCYTHNLRLFNGYSATFKNISHSFDTHLVSKSVVFRQPEEDRHLILNPFIISADQINYSTDVFLLNSFGKNESVYDSSQFGQDLKTTHKGWTDGEVHQKVLNKFFNRFKSEELPIDTARAKGEPKVPPDELPTDVTGVEGEEKQFQQDRPLMLLKERMSNAKFRCYMVTLVNILITENNFLRTICRHRSRK